MPLIAPQPGTDIVKIPATSFAYSMIKLGDLEATEYTLVSIVNDVSGSVSAFKTEMEVALQAAVESCLKSPRADNLLIRHTTFDDKVKTNHDWKMLKYINSVDYQDCLHIGGATALYAAAEEALTVMGDTGERLTKGRFGVNGIAFFITDGDNNVMTSTPKMVKKVIDNIIQGEKMESLITILIGVGTSGHISARLDEFKNDAGLTHFLELKDASKGSLAKLAAFVSKSISSQSQALGTLGPSKQLTSQNLTI